MGADVTGIDTSTKWLSLAEINARGEVEVDFLQCDASKPTARQVVPQKFDFILLNDVLEHIYDTVGLLENINHWLAEDGIVFFKVPNGMAGTAVLAEGHKRIFGISVLNPDVWHAFTPAPFYTYHRRQGYFPALFESFGLDIEFTNEMPDRSEKQTRAHILKARGKVLTELANTPLRENSHFGLMRTAVEAWVAELDQDLDSMGWHELWYKYRCTFWEGFARRSHRNALRFQASKTGLGHSLLRRLNSS